MATTYLPGAVRPANPSRRALIGALAAAPAFAAVPAVAAATTSTDPVWPKLVADFRAKYASWLATIDLEDEATAAFRAACVTLPPRPMKPDTGLPDDIHDMTIRQIKATSETPRYKAAWSAYERDHLSWETQRDALREEMVAPAKATYDRALAIRSAALDALTSYRVINLSDLAEKIEIIAADHDGAEIPQEYLAEVLADVRHLAAGMA